MAKEPKTEIEGGAATEAPRFVATVTAISARRRAGFAFGPTPVHLTAEQLETKLADKRTLAEALKGDPQLVIRPYEALAETKE